MSDCIFCKISQYKMTTKLVYEDHDLVAFSDIVPKAPIHFLIVPKKHIATLNEIKESDENLIGKMVLIAKKLAIDHNISESGYRLVFNVRRHAGQIVDHIHLHLLGGEKLGPMA